MTTETDEERKARRRAYTAAYRARNVEKVREAARQYTAKRNAIIRADPEVHERAKAAMRAYNRAHKERAKALKRGWYLAHRDESIAASRARRAMHREDLNEQRKVNGQRTRAEFPWKKLLQGALNRSRKKNVPFALTEEWAAERWTGRCEISGIPFVLTRRTNGPSFFSPSIDRIIPELGYIPSNCRFALWAVNALKHDGTDADMLMVAKAIVENFPVKSAA